MTKQDILSMLDEAKASHVRWHAFGQALIVGSECVEKIVPISHHECEFGKWYYSTGQLLDFLRNFSTVEQMHINLHIIYKELYEKSKKGIHKGIFENQEYANAKRKLELDNICNRLKETSNLLMAEINKMEKQINKMTPAQLVGKIMATLP